MGDLATITTGSECSFTGKHLIYLNWDLPLFQKVSMILVHDVSKTHRINIVYSFHSMKTPIWITSDSHSSLHRPFLSIRLHIPSFDRDFTCLPKGWKAATSRTTERP